MDKVLVADGNTEFLEATKAGLEKVRQFEVLTAANGRDAISLLSENPVSVLAADIEIPGFDALELLAYMSQKHPGTPCIVMIDRGKPWFKKRSSQQSFLYHLEKPFQIGSLVSAIFVGLNLRDEGINAQGMTMASLLPLLEIQQKTCRMQVRAAGKRTGFLYFENGEIIDAHCKDLSVHEAAMQIASWNRISFSFSELPRRRTRRRVKTKLMDFADATWSPEVKPLNGKNEPAPESQSEFSVSQEDFDEDDFEIIELLDEVEPDSDSDETRQARQLAGQIAGMLKKAEDVRDFNFICVFKADGNFLASLQHDGQTTPLELIKHLAGFMKAAEDTAQKAGIDTADAVILSGQNGVLVFRQIFFAAGHGPVWLLVACPPGSNWYFVKTCLDSF
jgi:CheY-like chemotaxis protein